MMVGAKNLLADLSRDKPEWIVIELSGSFPRREQKRKLIDFPPNFGPKPYTLERLEKEIEQLESATWLSGVVFRFEGLSIDLSTAYALRKQLERLEREMETHQATLEEIGERLNDSSMYEEDKKDQLQNLLRQQAENNKTLETLEEQWMELSSEIEDILSQLSN